MILNLKVVKREKRAVRFGKYRFNFDVFEMNGDKIFSLKNANFDYFSVAVETMLKKLK